MLSLYGIILVLTLILLLSFEEVNAETFDCSPQFSELTDSDSNVPFDYTNEIDSQNSDDLDITHVSYDSDGTTLNAELTFRETPKNYSSGWLAYKMNIDIDHNLNTGDDGIEYGYFYEYMANDSYIEEDKESFVKPGVWYFVIQKFVSVQQKEEIHRSVINYTDFYVGANKISFSVNLNESGNCPEKYGMVFIARDIDDSKHYEIVDATKVIEIPHPNTIKSYTIPEFLELAPGDMGIVTVKLDNESYLERRVDFSTDNQINLDNYENIKFEITNKNRQILPPNSFITNTIEVEALDTATPGTDLYTIGVTAKIHPPDDLVELYKVNRGIESTVSPLFYQESLEETTTSFSVVIISLWEKYMLTVIVVFIIVSTIIVSVAFFKYRRRLKTPPIRPSKRK